MENKIPKVPIRSPDGAPAVVRRRRKVVRPTRDQTPDAHSAGLHEKLKCSDSETSDSIASNPADHSEKNITEHKRRILELKNKKAISRRSLSSPRQPDSEDQADVVALMKKAKRSLSSPREKSESETLLRLQKFKASPSIPNLVQEPENIAEPKILQQKKDENDKVIDDVREEKKKLVESFIEAQTLSLRRASAPSDFFESSTDTCSSSEESESTEVSIVKPEEKKKEITFKGSTTELNTSLLRIILIESRQIWKQFKSENRQEIDKIKCLRNKCFSDLVIIMIFCGLGGIVFRFTEGTFESFYKCGVKRVKRDFVDQLWITSHNLREEDWKEQARNRLRKFEEELHIAHEAGMKTYSGQKGWSFLNGVVYCLTVVTTIGYGHISPVTTTGRAITIVYAIIGIPMFLILLADFGKLFTRCIKFVWAYVRRLYYTGSCKKVRRTAPMQEVMKGFNMVYDLATFRRPSQIAAMEASGIVIPPELQAAAQASSGSLGVPLGHQSPQGPPNRMGTATINPIFLAPPGAIGADTPQTPAPSNFEIDDDFNLPISIAIVILLAYIFIGATIYYIWEEWGFFESFYFVFISMSTIGFGDFVPKHPMYMMASIVYLVFGLALTSMCINVVQLKLSDSFRQASAKIGATIGLKMAEGGDGFEPTEEEEDLAEVHTSGIPNGDK